MTDWTSADWRDHFENNDERLLDIPWGDPRRLTEHESRAVADSIRQFQLGEGSDGRNFMRLAEGYARTSGDRDYVEALRLFILEEQRHSRDLGRFLDREGLARLKEHWTDAIFRRLRRLMGLDLCITVLVTAEIVARVYYKALRAATGSNVLRVLCDQILHDEAAHVAFQCSMLHRLRDRRSFLIREVASWLHRGLMLGAMAVVWLQHHRVYQAAGYSLFRYAGETLIELEKALAVVRDPLEATQLLVETAVEKTGAPFFVGRPALSLLFPSDE